MKKYKINIILVLIATGIVSCNNSQEIEPKAVALVKAKNNSNVSGTVTFRETQGKVFMQADIVGLDEGKHAIHIHELGDCSAHDASSAGGHWNPTMEEHGKWGRTPFHRGDIGNITADKDGNASLRLETDLWCIGCSDTTKNIVGKSVIIHDGIDDFTSQPSGDAGARIGCGKIVINTL